MSALPQRQPWWREQRAIDAAWVLVLGSIALWVFHRLGGFDL